MKIYIDEGGHFTPSVGVSVLCALSLPHATAGLASARISSISERWPRKDGELKGGYLNKHHLTYLTTTLFEHDALLHCIATDVALEDQRAIDEHKSKQCEGITRYLLRTLPVELIAKVKGLRATLEKMPNQLYVQFVLLSDLVVSAASHDAMYFSQRRPEDLAQFEWVIDAKDPRRVTTQEAWWRDSLGPLGESKSRAHPFLEVDGEGFDYSHFTRSFGITKDLWWPDRPRETAVRGIDVAKLITGAVRFSNSRADILLQAVDVLASFMRRVLNGEIHDDDIVRQLGRLQIRRKEEAVLQPFDFASFSQSPKSRTGLGRIAKTMSKTARSMIADHVAIK